MSVLPSPVYRAFANAEAGPSSYASSSHHSLPAYASTSFAPYVHYPEAGPSRPSTSRTHSVGSIVTLDREQKRVSRPLPRIPVASAPATPLGSPAERVSYPRPLPTPPLRADTPSPAPSCSSPVRPLPVPGSAPCPHQNSTPTSALLRPTLSLLVNTPGKSTTEIALSPMCTSPISPVVFNTAQESPTVEEHVAKRLSTLGFVEVDRPQPSMDTQLAFASLPERRSTESTDSERQATVEIRVELVSDEPEKRTSRLWIFEKKGKRRIESNYNEILHQLRKL